jgi:hypothetical protein
MNGRLWQPHEIEYLRVRYPNVPTWVICVSLDRSDKSVYSAATTYGLKKSDEFLITENSGRIHKLSEKGKQYRFKKGIVPINKGKKWNEFMTEKGMSNSLKTTFKKGAIPPNRKPVGYERISKDGYVEVKVAEGMRQFKLKHRLIYEQHYGPIPKGCNVQFQDGNKLNLNPENLVLKTRKENMKENTYHNYGPEISGIIQLRGVLTRQINKRQKLTK